MSLFLLIVAFVCTGLNAISNKAVYRMGLGNYLDIYSIGFWASGVVLGAFVLFLTRSKLRKQDAPLGLAMGMAGAVAMIFLLAALQSMNTFVVFPVRSCGNVAITAVLSYFIWREEVTLPQWLGIASGILSIYLLIPSH